MALGVPVWNYRFVVLASQEGVVTADTCTKLDYKYAS
jgi:hypothetical protein